MQPDSIRRKDPRLMKRVRLEVLTMHLLLDLACFPYLFMAHTPLIKYEEKVLSRFIMVVKHGPSIHEWQPCERPDDESD